MDDRLILVIVPVAIFAWVVLRSWQQERRKNRQPTISIRAVIAAVRLESKTVNGAYGRTNLIGHHVTFRTAEGALLELTAPENVGHLPVGTTGVLTYQGSKCERFDPAS